MVPAFWRRVLELRGKPEMRHHERVSYLLFAIHAFQSLENEAVRGQALQLVSLPTWNALSRGRLQLELHAHPKLAKHWRHAAKKVQLRLRRGDGARVAAKPMIKSDGFCTAVLLRSVIPVI